MLQAQSEVGEVQLRLEDGQDDASSEEKLFFFPPVSYLHKSIRVVFLKSDESLNFSNFYLDKQHNVRFRTPGVVFYQYSSLVDAHWFRIEVIVNQARSDLPDSLLQQLVKGAHVIPTSFVMPHKHVRDKLQDAMALSSMRQTLLSLSRFSEEVSFAKIIYSSLTNELRLRKRGEFPGVQVLPLRKFPRISKSCISSTALYALQRYMPQMRRMDRGPLFTSDIVISHCDQFRLIEKFLFEHVKRNHVVQNISIDYCNLDDKAFSRLLKIIQRYDVVSRLSFRGNRILGLPAGSVASIPILVTVLAASSVKTLDLSDNMLNFDALRLLVKTASDNALLLESLNVSSNLVSFSTVKILDLFPEKETASEKRQCRLHHVDLSANFMMSASRDKKLDQVVTDMLAFFPYETFDALSRFKWKNYNARKPRFTKASESCDRLVQLTPAFHQKLNEYYDLMRCEYFQNMLQSDKALIFPSLHYLLGSKSNGLEQLTLSAARDLYGTQILHAVAAFFYSSCQAKNPTKKICKYLLETHPVIASNRTREVHSFVDDRVKLSYDRWIVFVAKYNQHSSRPGALKASVNFGHILLLVEGIRKTGQRTLVRTELTTNDAKKKAYVEYRELQGQEITQTINEFRHKFDFVYFTSPRLDIKKLLVESQQAAGCEESYLYKLFGKPNKNPGADYHRTYNCTSWVRHLLVKHLSVDAKYVAFNDPSQFMKSLMRRYGDVRTEGTTKNAL